MNNTTQLEQVKAAHSELLQGAHISHHDWFWLMIDKGLQFAKHIASLYPNSDEVESTLKFNKQFGYWPWFKANWIMDDVALVDTKAYVSTDYKALKSYLVNSELLEQELVTKINKF